VCFCNLSCGLSLKLITSFLGIYTRQIKNENVLKKCETYNNKQQPHIHTDIKPAKYIRMLNLEKLNFKIPCIIL